MPDLHLRLIVDVTYNTNRVNPDELGQKLQDMVRFAMGDGLVTGESAAEVESWKTKVQKVPLS